MFCDLSWLWIIYYVVPESTWLDNQIECAIWIKNEILALILIHQRKADDSIWIIPSRHYIQALQLEPYLIFFWKFLLELGPICQNVVENF